MREKDLLWYDQGRRKVHVRRSVMSNDTGRSRNLKGKICQWVCLYQSLMVIVMLTRRPKAVCE